MKLATAAGGTAAALAIVAPVIVCPNAASIPAWACDALEELAVADYVALPPDFRQLDRQRFAHLVAQALTNLNDERKIPRTATAVPYDPPAPESAPPQTTTAKAKAADAPSAAKPLPAKDAVTQAADTPSASRPIDAASPSPAAPAAPTAALESEADRRQRAIREEEAAEAALAAQSTTLKAEYQQALQELRRLTQNERQMSGSSGGNAERRSDTRQEKERQIARVEALAGALRRIETSLSETRQNLAVHRMQLEKLALGEAAASDTAEREAAANPEDAEAILSAAMLGTKLAEDEAPSLNEVAPPAVVRAAPMAYFVDPAAVRARKSGTPKQQTAPSEHLREQALRLREEFAEELAAEGFFDDEAAKKQAASTLPPRAISRPRFKLDGAARYDFGHHEGPQSIGSRSRLRLRLYPDYNIDNNWHFLGMFELEKILHGRKGSKDGNPVLDRYYLEGFTGITLWDIGAFGSTMAEGNIYDSKFIGLRARVGDPVEYTIEAGQADSRHIYMLNYRRPIGIFDFGAMYLRGRGRGPADNGNGYVFTLSWGKEDSWRPGAQMAYLKYYHQPASTYVEHTMNGMADYMHGFRGWGLGYTYTIARDWLLSVEIDRLQDLLTHDYNNTIWGAITYFFKTYKD